MNRLKKAVQELLQLSITFDFPNYINGDLIKSLKLSDRLFWHITAFSMPLPNEIHKTKDLSE